MSDRQISLPALALWAFLAVSALYVTYRGIEGIRGVWGTGTDFQVFYASGKMLVSDQRALIYGGGGKAIRPEFVDAVPNFFNPPLLGLFYSPLTVLPRDAAKATTLVLLVIAAAATIWQLRRWARRREDLILMGLAYASFWPAYTSLQVGQPSIAFALAACVAFIALYEKRDTAAGLSVALLALKPSVALAHIGLVFFLGSPRAIKAALAGVVLFAALPFLIVGPDGIREYLNLLSVSRGDAFVIVGRYTAGAAQMFNWNGFYGRLTLTPPAPAIMFPLYLVTAALMVKVWSGRLLLESWLAAALATNLAIPHMLYYDLVLLLPPAFALALTRREPLLLGLFAAVHLAINASMWQLFEGGIDIGTKHGYMFLFATPAMFLLLAYFAFEPEINARRARQASMSLQAAPAGP